MTRKRISSNSPWEKKVGFSRAVRASNQVFVAGTAPIEEDGTTAAPGDVYGQTLHCLTIAKEALESAGAKLEDVVRTRVMLTDAQDWEAAAKAHGEVFAHIKPACTFVEVAGFIDPAWRVEIEVDAVMDEP